MISRPKVGAWPYGEPAIKALPSSPVRGFGEKIEYIIDSAAFNQGKYSPATHIEIISPAEALSRAADAIIIAAPAYTKEILGVILSTYPSDTHVSALWQDGIEVLHQPVSP
ncbi:MAG: hypothetical protein FJ082_08675 [Cyanobacteria bacterium K_Offshore_surface_m2_011]|nr:hypothetical protein [Cyanobacteria bacterium K_Offshore_surface_m2_011]